LSAARVIGVIPMASIKSNTSCIDKDMEKQINHLLK
jgi:hypothetical protein